MTNKKNAIFNCFDSWTGMYRGMRYEYLSTVGTGSLGSGSNTAGTPTM
jgi:hypothetical protein